MTAQTVERLPEINYTSRDFSSIRVELENWVQVNKPELWNDFFESNLGEFLIQLIAYHGDLLSFAIDRVSEESFLATNRLYKSALRHAKMIAYKPHGATASSVTVKADPLPDGIATYAVDVAKDTRISLGNDLYFEVDQDYNFPAASTEIEFTMIEGVFGSEDFVATGDPFLRLSTDVDLIIDSSWKVYVDSVEWTCVEFVELEITATQTYSVDYQGNRAIIVRFGDGVTGAIPPTGADILVEYRVGGGLRGNLPAGGINSTCAAMMNGSGISLSIINETAAAGGSDRESLEHIQRWGPLNVRTVDKAISREDYDTEASSFSDPTYGTIARAKSKLRVGTLAIPNPIPAEEFLTDTSETTNESLGHPSAVFNERVAMSFKLSAPIQCYRAYFRLARVGNAGPVTLTIEGDAAGAPSGTKVNASAEVTIAETAVGLTPEWYQFNFPSTFRLQDATTYWLVLTATADTGTGNSLKIYGDSASTYPDGEFKYKESGQPWAAGTEVVDAAFKIEPDPYEFVWVVGQDSFTENTAAQSLGNVGGTYNNSVAMSFTIAAGPQEVSRIQFYLEKQGLPGDIAFRIETDSAGAPSGTLAFERAFADISEQNIYGQGFVLARLGSQGDLAAGTYWIVLELGSAPALDHYYKIFGTLAPSYAGGKFCYHPNAGAWTDGTEIVDAAFRIDSGGPHIVHADSPITLDGKRFKALSEFEIDGKNIATFIDPNSVDLYTWVETVDIGGRRTYAEPSSGLKGALLNHLDPGRTVTTTTAFIHGGPMVPINLDLGVVIVNARYNLTAMETAIEDAIEEFFMDEDLQPGDAFRISDFYDHIEEVVGVEHFVERNYFDDITVEDFELIVRGTVTFTVEYPALMPLRDITARY